METYKSLLDTLKACDISDFKDWIVRLLSNLNIKECQWLHLQDYDYCLKAIDNANGCKCLIVARQYSMLVVDINEVRQFADLLTSYGFERGIYITTSSFSVEVKSCIREINGNISLIDGTVMARYLEQHKLFDLDKEEIIPAVVNMPKEDIVMLPRLREHKKLLRVTFPDGTVFCDKSPSQTLLQTIRHIGTETVASLGLEVCHVPLVSQSIHERYEKWIKPIGDGWYIMLQSDTDQKFRQLISINNQLRLNLIIEMNADIKAKSSNGNKRGAKKAKSQLMITFPDGNIVAGFNTTDTFVSFVEYVGADKVSKINLHIAGRDLVTPTQKYAGQMQLSNSKWLSIPNTTKDKYKIVKVISSMTHTNCEVTII